MRVSLARNEWGLRLDVRLVSLSVMRVSLARNEWGLKLDFRLVSLCHACFPRS